MKERFKLIKFGHRVVSVGLGVVAIGVPTMTTVIAEEVKNEWEKPRAEFIEDVEFTELLEKMKADSAYTLVEDSPVKDGELSTQVTEMKQAIQEVKTIRDKYTQDMADYKQAVEDYKAAKISYDEMVKIYNEKKAEYDAKVAQNKQLKKENEQLTADYNAKKEQYDKDLATYNQNVADIARIKQENETKKNTYLADKAAIESRNKAKKDDYDKAVQRRNDAVEENERKISEYEQFMADNPSLLNFADRGIELRGTYDDNYAYTDKGESTVYKNWWQSIMNSNGNMQNLWNGGLDFHNYGNADAVKYYANVFTMYNKEKIHELDYDYSLGDIGITNKTTMNITYKDSRVSEFDDQYGHNYKLTAWNQVVDNFLQFDLHNLGTTESGKTISAHVTVGKWHQSHQSATFTFNKNGTMGGYGEGVRATYEFYDEATGQPINLVRMFGIGDIEAGENLGITSNDKVTSIVPIAPRDVAKGYTPGTHGYASVQQMGEKTAWTFGDEHYANANFGPLPNDPVTAGNNNSTPLAQTIGIFSGNKLTASWNGAGGGLNLNSRNILFKEKPTKITDDSYPRPKEPDYERVPDEPEYTAVPDALPEPKAPEAPTLNTITEPVAPTAPGEAPTEPKKPEDINVAKTIHYHRAYKLKPVTTKWVDEEGNELKTPVTDDTTKEHGDITGYSFVRSDEDESENVTHVFKQHTTSWVDIDTNESLKNTEKGIKEHGDIEKYYFVESETKPTGDVVHKFRAVTTSYVTEKGEEVFPTEKGTHKEKAHKDYSYKRTEVDEHGNTKHIYVKFNTEYMDEDKNRIANREEGAKDPKEIPGYEYIRSIPDIENTLITHVYRQVTTSWVEEGGKELKPSDKGIQEHGEFSGYTYIRTETKSNGDVVHTFKKVSKEPTNDYGIVGFAVTSVLSLVGIVALKKKKQ